MAKDYAKEFYGSLKWKSTREAYAKSVGYLCEVHKAAGCIKPGELVHHKEELTPDNINNPDITLNFDNLMLVCRDCHAAIHNGKRFIVTEGGGIAPLVEG